ncbi:hypothetical protein Q5H92_14980 [Hymenobacter sp. M29]|uniref:Toprim domain-containing protein n=1 Tax=Hymenobacter mellowenesis TaxID=3063995 RepID=A0ABT9AFB3_9BACT|nr:hypothetical protein [Hymenobacter sp. M29]MDO7847671.1 hypothetical protein [Hymenobacter sp. M29]
MDDPLEALLALEVVNEERVLGLVDEYQLLCHYLGFAPELRTPFLSPIRGEGRGSFSLFASTRAPGKCEFLWKDSGNGKSGNVFHLIQVLYSLSSKQEVFKQIDRDFHLYLFPGNDYGEGKVPILHHEKPTPKAPAQIRVKSQEFTREALQYWAGYGIGVELLTQYRVSQVSHFWTQPHQLEPFTPKGMMFSFKIGNRYKLYQPYSKDLKFLNSLAEYMVEGWLQLTPGLGDLCVITKSTKDVLVLRSYGYEAVAARSETTPILPRQLQLLEEKYKRLVVMYDNDITKEVNVGQVQASKYHYPSIKVPDELAWKKMKDISDVRKEMGEDYTRQLLKTLLT